MTNRRINRVLVAGMLAIAGVVGGILQFTSSSGNLAKTAARLESEGWLVTMLALGVLGLVFVGLVVFAGAGQRSKRSRGETV